MEFDKNLSLAEPGEAQLCFHNLKYPAGIDNHYEYLLCKFVKGEGV